MIAIVEAPDEMTMTALGLSLGALGFVRTQTLRAFSETEMQTILRKMALPVSFALINVALTDGRLQTWSVRGETVKGLIDPIRQSDERESPPAG